jgi:hypothetical protein
MPQFSPDQVAFDDASGYGAFDIGHAREHIQFVQVLAGQAPPIVIPDYNLLSFFTAGSARGSIVQSHSDAHNLLRSTLGITGVDLTVIDFKDQDSFYDWIGYHATEHAQIRQILGLT